MPRLTQLDDVLFPVEEHSVFVGVRTKSGERRLSVPGKKAIVNTKTNQVLEDQPQYIKKGENAMVRLQPIKKFPIEKFKDFPELGRVAVRDMGRTVSVGVVLSIHEAPAE